MGMEGTTNHDNDSLSSASLSPSKVQKSKGVELTNFENNDPTGEIADVWARGVGEEDGNVKVSHSKKVIKHALKQQAKRRRKNTNIAAGCNSAPRLQSHGSPSELDEVNVNVGVCYRQPTMAEVLASIPGFNLKPRKRSNKKLSAAAQLEQTKEGCVDLETPDSILVNSNLRQLMNKHTFSSLPPLYQYKLLQLLPHVDRTPGHSEFVYRLSPSGLNNEFFARACMDWRERLTEGEFTPENQAKLKADQEKEKTKLDPWKLKHFEPMWGESLEEWPSVPPGVLERCGAPGAINASIINQEPTAPPPVKKKRGSGSTTKPPAPPPPPRPVRTVGAVTRAQASYREKRQAELSSQQNNKKPKSGQDENVVDSSTSMIDSNEQTEDKLSELPVCTDVEETIKAEPTSLEKSPKTMPKNSVSSVKSPLRVCNSQSPVKSPVPKSPVSMAKSPIQICKSPSPSVRSPTPSSKSPILRVTSPVPSCKSPLPMVKSPSVSSKSPMSSTKSPVHVRSPVTSVKSPITELKSPETCLQYSPVPVDSPLPNETEEVSGSDAIEETDLMKSSENLCSGSHLLYQVEECEDTLTERLDDTSAEKDEVDTSACPSTESTTGHDKMMPLGTTETATNETSVSVSSIETTIVYSVSNCSSDISFTDKRDCEISEVSCSTENLEPSFDPLERLDSNNVLGSDVTGHTESDLRPVQESPKSTKIEESLEKPEEEDWEIIKVDPNSSETLQDDQVSGLCSNEGSNLSCVTTNTEPDKLDEGSKCSSFNTEESYNATDVLLYQDPLKEDEAALLAAAWDAVGSTTTDKILRDFQNQQQELNTIVPGEVSVIPCQEELEVRLEETSLPSWNVVTSQPQDAQPPTQHSHVKLELEVTLTPEVDSQVSSSTVDGGSIRKEVGCCQPVIPPTTIVCLPPATQPTIVVPPPAPLSSLPPPGLPPLQQPMTPASSSSLPYIALTTSTPVRALPTKTISKNCGLSSSSRIGRNAMSKPPPGAVNLERSYQICQAVIQNSPNRDQLQGQLRPPPGLRPTVTHRTTVRPVNTTVQGVRFPPGTPRPKPQQVLLKQVFTSQHHGIPVNMAVLPNSPHHINNNHQMSEYVIMRSGGGLRRSNSAPPGGGGGGRLVGTAPRPASAAAPPQTNTDCLCSLKPMQACLKCGAFCHQDCISPSRLCITCFTQ